MKSGREPLLQCPALEKTMRMWQLLGQLYLHLLRWIFQSQVISKTLVLFCLNWNYTKYWFLFYSGEVWTGISWPCPRTLALHEGFQSGMENGVTAAWMLDVLSYYKKKKKFQTLDLTLNTYMLRVSLYVCMGYLCTEKKYHVWSLSPIQNLKV